MFVCCLINNFLKFWGYGFCSCFSLLFYQNFDCQKGMYFESHTKGFNFYVYMYFILTSRRWSRLIFRKDIKNRNATFCMFYTTVKRQVFSKKRAFRLILLKTLGAQKNRYSKCNFQVYLSDIYLFPIKPCSRSFKSPYIFTSHSVAHVICFSVHLWIQTTKLSREIQVICWTIEQWFHSSRAFNGPCSNKFHWVF